MSNIRQVLKNLDDWREPGPKAAGWYNSKAPMAFIMGPVAGGKTWTGCMKALDIARLQHPSTHDGARKAVVTAVRQNYRLMHDTLLVSWFKLFPDDIREWPLEFVKHGPVTHTIKLNDPKLGPIHLEMRFRAYGEKGLDSFTRGNETTAWWLNETDELDPHCLGLFYERTGRAFLDQRPRDKPPVLHNRVFGDFNAPDEDSWIYEDLFLNPTEGVEVYLQPGGREPDAENLHNLHVIDPDYYANLAAQMTEWDVARRIDNRIGMSRVGKPVYPQFRDAFHVSRQTLRPEPGPRLIVGIDPGRVGAAVIGQNGERGAKLFRECVTPAGEAWDAKIMAEKIADELTGNGGMFEPFLHASGIVFAPDPTYAPQQTGIVGDVNWLLLFVQRMDELLGLCPIEMPRTNHIDPRLVAVRNFLASPDGRPRLLVDPSMLYTRRAMNGGYRMIKKQGANGEYKVEPEKNAQMSDVANALEYFALVAGNPVGMAASPQQRAQRAGTRANPRGNGGPKVLRGATV